MGSISLASPAAANQSRNWRATARCALEKKVQVKAPVDSDQWARSSARLRMRPPSARRSSTVGEPFNIGLFVVSRLCFGKFGMDIAWLIDFEIRIICCVIPGSPPSVAPREDGAGLDRLSDTEYALFAQLSDAYRQKFHIPFIVSVRRHTKESILRQYQRRLQNTRQAELETALNEIFRIAALRLSDRVKAADELPASGRLSTHVLDNHDGRPAQGVALALSELGDDGTRRVIIHAVTYHDSRTAEPLIGAASLPLRRF